MTTKGKYFLLFFIITHTVLYHLPKSNMEMQMQMKRDGDGDVSDDVRDGDNGRVYFFGEIHHLPMSILVTKMQMKIREMEMMM